MIMNPANLSHKWLDHTLYPFESKLMQLESGWMHYIDEGTGNVLLFVRGTPTWSFLYRDFIRTFSIVKNKKPASHLVKAYALDRKPEIESA